METIDYIKEIIDKSEKGEVNWFGSSSKSCFTGHYQDDKFIVCKYFPSDSPQEVSCLTFLDKDGCEIEDKIFEYDNKTKEYELLNNLYSNLSTYYKEQFERE